MISFNYETDFSLENEAQFSAWISKAIQEESCKEGEINYIFCTDDYLHQINLDFLDHDTLTDIISFDYSVGKELHGDIYISVDNNTISVKQSIRIKVGIPYSSLYVKHVDRRDVVVYSTVVAVPEFSTYCNIPRTSTSGIHLQYSRVYTEAYTEGECHPLLRSTPNHHRACSATR